jgi:tRNA (adenine37-N6)-methyltransferase
MNEINFKPIGLIHSLFKSPKGVPIQTTAAKGVKGRIEIYPEFAEGLTDLDGFSHIMLISYFHMVKNASLVVTPFLDSHQHGVFATRASGRPNPIGFSIVELEKIDGNFLYVLDVDLVNGTPILDIKPCIPQFDFKEVTKIGWLQNVIHKLPEVKDDGRFIF